jgi:hypothetical protein
MRSLAPWRLAQISWALATTLEFAKVNTKFSPNFLRIRDAVWELLDVRMDTLARKFHTTHDMAASDDEIYRLVGEHSKVKEPWVFRAKF